MTEADFRNALRGVLHRFDDAVEAAIRRALAEPLVRGRRSVARRVTAQPVGGAGIWPFSSSGRFAYSPSR
jgi:hypothetical protein